jgi:Icc-related predicted phosphoesterase
MSNTALGKILFISDVHGLIPEMIDFINWLLNYKKYNIAYAVHLGDFWSGRNYDGTQQIYNEFEDLECFKNLKIPLYLLKGNEDLETIDAWWESNNIWLMKDQEPFNFDNYKVLPIDYHFRGEESDRIPKHPEFNEGDEYDFILSHRPPYGLLDNTLHYQTHKKLTNTGSPVVRAYVDNIKPVITFFGHFHYSNYLIHDNRLIVCLDKLIRVGRRPNHPRNSHNSGSGRDNSNFRYSYALLDPSDQILEVYWKNRLFFKYSLLERKIIYLKRVDKRILN